MKKVATATILYDKPYTIAIIEDAQSRAFHAGIAKLAPKDTYDMNEAIPIAISRALRAKYGTNRK